MNYKAELDGLRAFAVISVIINHFNKDFLPSGYLGVDIFFVISGYVITASLAKRENKNFLEFILGFYERRIKRLIPALVVFTLITSLLVCFFIYDPEKILSTGISSLFGFSNINLFFKSQNYFAEDTALNPFTHTWSLGIEEQFYFIFPFIIWFTGFGRKTKNGPRNLFFVIALFSIISLCFFIYAYPINQPAAYFLLPSRFWEMSTGCLVFLGIQKKSFFTNTLVKIPPSLILIIIVGLFFLPTHTAVFSTISIVLLTVCLICCLRTDTLIYEWFTKPSIVKIGLISYSLYLWHWGVLSISRWTIGIHWWSVPFQVLIIYLLSFNSYRWIEIPFRNNNWSRKRWITIIKGILTLISSFIIVNFLEGLSETKLFLGKTQSIKMGRYFETFNIDKDFCRVTNVEYTFKNILNKCSEKRLGSNQTLLFIGDSHTEALYLGAEYLTKKTNSDLFIFSAGGQSFPSVKYFRVDSKEKRLKRHEILRLVEKEIFSIIKEDDILFITLRLPYHFGDDWYEYPAEDFRFFDSSGKIISKDSKKEHFQNWLNEIKDFSEELNALGAKLVISTPTPEFPEASLKRCNYQNDQWFNKFSRVNCSIPKEFFTQKGGKYAFLISELEKVSLHSKNIYLFDSFKIFCPQKQCYFSDENNLLYADKDHISNYAARYIYAPEMLKFLKNNQIIDIGN